MANDGPIRQRPLKPLVLTEGDQAFMQQNIGGDLRAKVLLSVVVTVKRRFPFGADTGNDGPIEAPRQKLNHRCTESPPSRRFPSLRSQ